ncbi:TY-Chap domain-containing protein [Nocardia anaemiae]|uniref:TY-Chap domain-containing protein n=1 Tax=Nocardia anaemiae TaxID=263910 RepID=UPI0007A3CE75|nr:hypothetical protein [Nocardia anaemiae]
MTEPAPFAESLTEKLAVMTVSTISRFVQFAIDKELMVAESSGDAHLDPIGRPTSEGQLRISDAGWQLPDTDHVDNWLIATRPVHDARKSNDDNKLLILSLLGRNWIDAT